MKRGKKLFVYLAAEATLAALAGSTAAFSYDGPQVDINFVNQKPAKYSECDQYLNDGTARRYAACEFGRDEAERMASRFAGGQGKLQGYLRGFSWGMFKMMNAYKDNGDEIAAGQKMADGMGSYMESGRHAGRDRGASDGGSLGTSDALARFKAVIDTGREPDPSIVYPPTQYTGEKNGYERVVGKVPTAKEIIENEIQPGNLRVYNELDSLYLSDVQPVSIWDLLFDNGTYVFEKAKWYDPALAMDVWLQRPNDQKPKYDNLNNPPIYQDPVPPSKTPTQLDMQTVFQKSFKDSYAYYVNYYFSSEFQQNMDLGQTNGEIVGVQLGKRLAQYKGIVDAFNRKYQESSLMDYTQAFQASYGQSFSTTFDDYLHHPQLSLEFTGEKSEADGGIFQPGGWFEADFTVVNLGGAPATLTVNMSGDVMDANTQTFSMPRLRTMKFKAQKIARFDERLKARQDARLVLDVNGIRDARSQTLQQLVELSNIQPSIRFLDGAGEISIDINNISTIRTPGDVDVLLYLNQYNVDVRHLGFMESGSSRPTILSFSGFDPFSLMKGEVSARVQIVMNGRVLDELQASFQSQEILMDIARYFNLLANGKGFVPRGKDRDERFGEVVAWIVGQTEAEVKEHNNSLGYNPWSDNPGETMPGKVLSVFRGTTQSAQAKDAYDRLGAEMWRRNRYFHNVLFFFHSGRQKAFQDLVRPLSKAGDY